MNHRPSTQRILQCLVITLAAVALQASAQAPWPDKPLRIVIPFPPGGPSDIVIRLVAQKMQASLKQTIVIEPKAGAGGNLGSAEVARSAPDGTVWLWATDTVATVNPHVYKTMGFRPDDLVPVTLAVRFSQVLVCGPQVGVKTLAELVTKARAEKMAYASGGAGVPGHLSMELLKARAGFDMQHVPYKGPAPATQDVLGGQVPCGLLAGPTVLPHVRTGKLTALAVSGSERSPNLPDVPTIFESGIKDAAADFALVLFAPKGTPAGAMTSMRQAFVEALQSPDVADKIKAADMVVVASTPEQAAASLQADFKKWGELARKINLGLD